MCISTGFSDETAIIPALSKTLEVFLVKQCIMQEIFLKLSHKHISQSKRIEKQLWKFKDVTRSRVLSPLRKVSSLPVNSLGLWWAVKISARVARARCAANHESAHYTYDSKMTVCARNRSPRKNDSFSSNSKDFYLYISFIWSITYYIELKLYLFHVGFLNLSATFDVWVYPKTHYEATDTTY